MGVYFILPTQGQPHQCLVNSRAQQVSTSNGGQRLNLNSVFPPHRGWPIRSPENEDFANITAMRDGICCDFFTLQFDC
jgi:hypothetical protein